MVDRRAEEEGAGRCCLKQEVQSFNEAEESQDLPSESWRAKKATDVVQFESGSLKTRRPKVLVLT